MLRKTYIKPIIKVVPVDITSFMEPSVYNQQSDQEAMGKDTPFNNDDDGVRSWHYSPWDE